MNSYQPQADRHAFLLMEVLRAPSVLAELPALAEHADAGLLTQVIDEAGKFVGEVIAPLNREGDEVGAQWKAGAVTMPPGFRDAYQAFWQAGWPSLACATDDGGQGLPTVLEAVLHEQLNAANHGWTMAPGLLHGAYECLRHHASDEIKARYLGKLASGEWLATMCLTEPHAGSDLGLVRTKAVPQADGHFALSGTKIFISGGEHDLTDNIVHLVLARLPDAPPGPKGLSLFLVPKFHEDGTRSAVHCERIEEKMGLHGSPTCVMRFDEARAAIVGEPGKGLNAMFVMMNAARLLVGLQGVGLLDAAWQKAHAYAQERRQMRAPGSASKAGEADAIALHPAMQRILDTQRAWVDAGRVVAYRTALELDTQKHHPDAARREAAARWCSLVTPVLKSAWTEQAFTGASACLQVLGGHGYVREWGIEQHVRDARVAMIYEGTNEIQAIDLLVRKTLPDGAAALQALLADLGDDLRALPEAGRTREALARFALFVRDRLVPATRGATAAPERPYWLADDFLRATALLLMAWAWERVAATPQAPAGTPQAANAFWRWVWPEFDMRLGMLDATLSS
ncbi:MAG: acyl-CoA dehydrogenase family protein [Hydrogenophaga sp.]|jgi:alkylation response protein AidB-like acyl-CoA dehydrogenase|uniref:acyl-CoA dehydrogenase family protein n=1 Tax=Hydrogenophaga sp. TaxID=1904254 RepID=UPI001D91BABF|nr:acyl-CoA dehydrogenase family protein [Hydrogenophaga sp.]MBW0168827.1 acyl-CoA dehydrogenase family protein [Hydrogenophaga sp.]MBW0182341.1 acyl-CoA dehydrogenase family protein [Hydrogenophaga sp.]